ncbi:MAG: VirB3 family type IV secretion system protein [Terricaulis sp.]
MAPLQRDLVFSALTRPQCSRASPIRFFVLNLVITTEIFLITKSFWAILAALVIHGLGYAICLREPRFLDLWILRASRCPRVPNHDYWRCNSYSP